MGSAEKRRVNVLDMKRRRGLVGMSRMHRVRNEEVRRRAGIGRELASRVDQRVLRWFGQVERMDESRLARRVMMAEVSGGQVWGRPKFGWMEDVKVALGNRGMTVEAARRCARDRNEWRALVRMQMIEFQAAIFAWFLCSFGPPSRALGARGVGCRFMMELG